MTEEPNGKHRPSQIPGTPRRTKDNILIAYHDRIIENKAISELTYQDILGTRQDRRVSVPTFEAVLNLAKGRIRIDVDVKEVWLPPPGRKKQQTGIRLDRQ